MKIAIDASPLKSGHRFRGIGFYTQNLIKALKKIDKKNQYFWEAGPKILKKADLVHYPYFDLFFHTLPLKKTIPTVVTIHDVIPLIFPHRYPPGFRGSLRFLLQKSSLKNVEVVLTDSRASKKDIIKFLNFPEAKIFVTYLASGEEFKPLKDGKLLSEVRQKYRLPQRFVLYVGDINYNKNIPGLVRACQKIKIPLVVVSKQALEENIDRQHPENQDLVWLQDQIKKNKNTLGVEFSIIALGFIPKKDLVALYNLASLYCQTSFYEGFGLPVLEAMACGCPVVASNTSSLPEVCGQAALLVNPRELNNLAKGIKLVLNDHKLRKGLIKKGLAQAKKFSWEKTAQETLGVYEKVYRQK